MLRTRVLTALVLLAALLLVLLSRSFHVFAAALAIFFAAASWESARLFGSKRPQLPALLWTAVFLFLLYRPDERRNLLLFALCCLLWALRFAPSLRIGLPPVDGIGNRLLGTVYQVALLGCFVAMAALLARSPLFLFTVFAIVWLADIGAYFSGKAFGKHKLAPGISPGKSWEGAIGGWLVVLVAAIATVLLAALGDSFPAALQAAYGWAGMLLVLTLIVVASVVGDLFESQLKRRAGMKDSSGLLPGHGGVLDRIDALVPTLPLAALLASRI